MPLKMCEGNAGNGCRNCEDGPDLHDGCSVCLKLSPDTFRHEALQGWPYAIRRAMVAEAEVDRLRNELQILQEQSMQRNHY